MLYSIPMYLQHESKSKRLRIVYLPPAIVVGFKNPDFQTLISLFLDGVFLKIITERVRDHFEKLYNSGFHQTTLPLATMLSSWWNVLLNRSGSEMVEDVVKVLDHIMKWERVNVYSAYRMNPTHDSITEGLMDSFCFLYLFFTFTFFCFFSKVSIFFINFLSMLRCFYFVILLKFYFIEIVLMRSINSLCIY